MTSLIKKYFLKFKRGFEILFSKKPLCYIAILLPLRSRCGKVRGSFLANNTSKGEKRRSSRTITILQLFTIGRYENAERIL